MKKRRWYIGAVAVLAAVACGVLLRWGAAKDVGFMAPMSVYYAAGEGEESWIPLTCFFRRGRGYYRPEDVTEIYLGDVGQQIAVADFEVKPSICDWGYEQYSVSLTLRGLGQGQCDADHLVVTLRDGQRLRYPIGDWHFDIGPRAEAKQEEQMIDLWQSPGMTSSPDQFPYSYTTRGGAAILRLQVGDGQTIETGGESGTAPLEGWKERVKYIKSKVTVKKDGQEYVFYGKGCICGMANLEKSEIEAWSQSRGQRLEAP